MGGNHFDFDMLVLIYPFISFFLLKGHRFLCPSVMVGDMYFKFSVYNIKSCNANDAFFCYKP